MGRYGYGGMCVCVCARASFIMIFVNIKKYLRPQFTVEIKE